MPTFSKEKPTNEKELHGIIEKEFEALEEGLVLLKGEFSTNRGLLDFLCVDSGGKLAIVEVKLSEDENILFQALRYFSEIEKDRYVIAQIFPDQEIDPEQDPRIILIAERFSDDILRLSTLVQPDVELYEYTVLRDTSDKRGIVYHQVSLPQVSDTLSRPRTIEDHKDYITDVALRDHVDKHRDSINKIGDGIDEYPTQDYIGFRFRGRQFANISPHRRSFDLTAHVIGEKGKLLDYEFIRIETGEEDYSEIMTKIVSAYINLGGIPYTRDQE